MKRTKNCSSYLLRHAEAMRIDTISTGRLDTEPRYTPRTEVDPLDPVPAGNCKLQTLRQYYRLPERGAHTALGDVETVADLFATVLRPIAEQRGLLSWEQLASYAGEEWYPSRFAFGKHKGKSLADAGRDAGLRGWLEGLAKSANERNARMGRWYLRQLHEAGEAPVFVAGESAGGPADASVMGSGLVVYVNPKLQQLRMLVEAARGLGGGWRNWRRALRWRRHRWRR